MVFPWQEVWSLIDVAHTELAHLGSSGLFTSQSLKKNENQFITVKDELSALNQTSSVTWEYPKDIGGE